MNSNPVSLPVMNGFILLTESSLDTFILFSFNEYSIYKKYNQVIIALGCSLIGIYFPSDFTQNFKEEDLNKYKKILQDEIKKKAKIKKRIIQYK